MANYILLCHGGLHEFSGFDLLANQTLQYRGNYGSPLNGPEAAKIVHALCSDPLVTEDQLIKDMPNYKQQNPCTGPASIAPDIDLQGDDHVVCFLMNMETRHWILLPSTWKDRLKTFIPNFFGPAPFFLNLLCCTDLAGGFTQPAELDKNLQVKDWKQVLH